jgi:hypothetical protein
MVLRIRHSIAVFVARERRFEMFQRIYRLLPDPAI